MEIFSQRLLEAVAWSAAHKQWTPELQPFSFEDRGDIVLKTDEECEHIIRTLGERRSELLKAQNIDVSTFASELSKGGIIAFSPEMSLWDGAAEVASEGFFDSSNTPAWDTWITFVVESENPQPSFRGWRSYLLAWVPPEYFELADAGIEVNPEECINWIQHVSAPFAKTLLQSKNVS